ncbi:hypothetical protein [[Phormidium] sp. ETS-05]|nr:hypothetical protein [[Phormidium] sp. ETS-05]
MTKDKGQRTKDKGQVTSDKGQVTNDIICCFEGSCRTSARHASRRIGGE